MTKKESYKNRIELLQGTLDMLILQALQWGPQHGHGIGQALRVKSSEMLQVETGSLYPALHRLEERGWVDASWGVSENNRQAKFYALTRRGRAQLQVETKNWARYAAAVFAALEAPPLK
jgi:PadR family transcriptional regulator PadR